MTNCTGHVLESRPPRLAAVRTEPHEVTIVVADDHFVVREGLRSLLASAPGIAVVAEAGSVRDTIAETVRHRPDVLLLGLHPPQHELSTLIHEVHRYARDVAVVMFSARDDDEAVVAAIRAGARGYLGRTTAKQEIIRSIRGVAAGWGVFSPRIADALTKIVAGSTVDARVFPELTAREYEILDLIAAGMSNLAIARRLHLSAKTISNHVSRIFIKLGVTDRAKAIVRARDAGLGTEI